MADLGSASSDISENRNITGAPVWRGIVGGLTRQCAGRIEPIAMCLPIRNHPGRIWLLLRSHEVLSLSHRRLRSRRSDAQGRDRPGGSKMKNHVYKILEIVGSSQTGIEDAINTAIELAGKTVRNMDWFEVVETRGHIKDGKIAHYQVALKIGFTLETQ